MHENPYNELLTAMQNAGSKDTPLVYLIGKVTKEEPLEVTATVNGQDLLLEAEDLKVNAMLKKGYTRRMTHADDSGEAEFTKTDLVEGVEVLMIPSKDKQTMYVISVLEAP